jgi:peptidoglycan/LPS O-acetylase OafA/YrhL
LIVIVLQVVVVIGIFLAPAVAGELAWQWLRRRRRYGRRIVGVGAATAIALVAADLALDVANPTIGGYLLFGIGVVTIVIFMTAYYAWRARNIAKRWSRRAEAENDPSRKRA